MAERSRMWSGGRMCVVVGERRRQKWAGEGAVRFSAGTVEKESRTQVRTKFLFTLSDLGSLGVSVLGVHRT